MDAPAGTRRRVEAALSDPRASRRTWLLLGALAAAHAGVALLDLGREAEALEAYARSLTVRAYLFGTDRFDALVRELERRRPGSREVARLALSHWLRRGDLAEVRRLLAAQPDLVSPSRQRH